MRDTLKNEGYFEDFLRKLESIDKKTEQKIAAGEVNTERIIPVRISMINRLINRIQAKYSLGLPVNSILGEYYEALELISKFWAGNCKFIGNKNEVLNQYSLGNYDTILWMLSLGYLLNIPEDKFLVLVNVIDKDNVRDKLFEFIISAKIISRTKIDEESYKYGFKLFGSIRKAIETKDLSMASSLVETFIEKEWFKDHKSSGWYDRHKNPHDTYSGFWCFEAAAVVKIMGLDDSSFINNQYYPKDLIHINNN